MSKLNPAPKKLTLRQALNATSKPIARLGDLICVDVDERWRNMGYTNCEMRSIFMPSLDVKIRSFSKPETESYLTQELYKNGGWLESIADFSDEALALHYNYGAGFITASGLAYDAGDPSQFERDCLEALATLPSLTPETRETVRRNILLMHKKYKLAANQGSKTSQVHSEKAKKERPIKNDEGKTLDAVIADLAHAHPDEKPSEIWPHLKTAIREWSGSDCEEIRPSENARDNWQYRFIKPDGSPDTISYQSFRKKLKAK